MKYDLPFIKIPAAMLTNKPLLEACASSCKKVILSTGMSTEDEISEAVSILDDKITVKSRASYALLHCNSTYPAPLEELNLSCIKTLKEKYNCEVGYSGHEFRLGTSVSAIYLGATIIERHITVDRSMWGSDHLCSIEPQGLFKLVSGIRELEKAFGDGKIRVTEAEKLVRTNNNNAIRVGIFMQSLSNNQKLKTSLLTYPKQSGRTFCRQELE